MRGKHTLRILNLFSNLRQSRRAKVLAYVGQPLKKALMKNALQTIRPEWQ
jgi:hypothetical protein